MTERPTRSSKYQSLLLEVPHDFTTPNQDFIKDYNTQYTNELLIDKLYTLDNQLKKTLLSELERVLTSKQFAVVKLIGQGKTQEEIAKQFNTIQSTINHIVSGKSYETKQQYGVVGRISQLLHTLTPLIPILKEMDELYDQDLPITLPYYAAIRNQLRQDYLELLQTGTVVSRDQTLPKQFYNLRTTPPPSKRKNARKSNRTDVSTKLSKMNYDKLLLRAYHEHKSVAQILKIAIYRYLNNDNHINIKE